jgi:hypothetical protein
VWSGDAAADWSDGRSDAVLEVEFGDDAGMWLATVFVLTKSSCAIRWLLLPLATA